MGILAGAFVVAAALLALAGWFKLRRPAATARALKAAGLRPLAPFARALGAAEVVVGVGALVVDSRLLAVLVAGFYLAFAAFVGLSLLRAAPLEDCGCFGGGETPPGPVHLVLDLAAAAVAGAVAAGAEETSLVSALDGQPLGGIPFVLLAAVVTGLAYAALTVLPRTLAELEGRP